MSVEDDLASEAPPLIPLKPMAISGLCITKAALIEALRVYVPLISDLEVVEDGERFLLSIATPSEIPPEIDSSR